MAGKFHKTLSKPAAISSELRKNNQLLAEAPFEHPKDLLDILKACGHID